MKTLESLPPEIQAGWGLFTLYEQEQILRGERLPQWGIGRGVNLEAFPRMFARE